MPYIRAYKALVRDDGSISAFVNTSGDTIHFLLAKDEFVASSNGGGWVNVKIVSSDSHYCVVQSHSGYSACVPKGYVFAGIPYEEEAPIKRPTPKELAEAAVRIEEDKYGYCSVYLRSPNKDRDTYDLGVTKYRLHAERMAESIKTILADVIADAINKYDD